jgi:hypothetical protein
MHLEKNPFGQKAFGLNQSSKLERQQELSIKTSFRSNGSVIWWTIKFATFRTSGSGCSKEAQ